MKIDDNFVELILHDFILNKKQCEILGFSFPPADGWESLIMEKDISTADTNLLILLKGKLALKTQEQIVKNYKTLSNFRKPKIDNSEKKETVSVKNTEAKEMQGISIYCDGACSGNPGKAGSGIAVYSKGNKPVLYHGDYVENGTNNIAELNALHKAMKLCKESHPTEHITIFSDSKYSIDCITTWAYGWKAKGWTKKSGEIKNLELIKGAHELFETLKNRITIKHVKGHAGIEGNELADRMAVYTIKSKSQNYEIYTYETINEVLSLTSY